jgi:uncharacterized iron-regulated membrane protein
MRAKRTRVSEDIDQQQGYPPAAELRVGQRTSLRQVIFWLHLATGVVAGLIIGVMSATGVLLAFENQMTAWAERAVRTIPPPALDATRLSLDALVAQARAAWPESRSSGVILRAEPTAAVQINFGRERVLFVNPYTGEVVGEGATRLRTFLHTVTDWHRWLGMEGEHRDLGRAITGACNAAFAGMVMTGMYLWWPRRWTRRALTAILVPGLTLRGRPRDWNWHHVAGIWSAVILLSITLTGVVMSYQWANNLLYTLTGNTPPPPRAGAGGSPEGNVTRQARTPGNAAEPRRARAETRPAETVPARAPLETLLATAMQQAPHWRSIILRLPQREAAQMSVTLEEATALHPYPRSLLTLDTTTAAVVQWEPYTGYNLGRTLRAWVRPVHTGEAGGISGQIVAALASSAALVLLWTGLALTWRRFFGRRGAVSS